MNFNDIADCAKVPIMVLGGTRKCVIFDDENDAETFHSMCRRAGIRVHRAPAYRRKGVGIAVVEGRKK